MNFTTVKAALVSLLTTASGTDYRVVGAQEQGISAESILNDARLVQVFYSQGSFPKSGGARLGPSRHLMTFRVEFFVSKAAAGDVSALEAEAATDMQRATALANFVEASALADASLDELFSLVYTTLMDNRNQDLSLGRVLADRWVDNFSKDQSMPRGEYVTYTASCNYTCAIEEEFAGSTPTVATDVIEVTVDPNVDIDNEVDDDVEKTGVSVQL